MEPRVGRRAGLACVERGRVVTRTVAGVPASDLSASDLLKAWPSIADPDDGRLGFYLRLDPLTWG